MSLREDLLAAAPEGVTYVYTERMDTGGMRFFWHDGTWRTVTWGIEGALKCTPDSFWAFEEHTKGIAAEELSRRFAARYTMLNQWMLELGIENEFYRHLTKTWGIEDIDCFDITPQQQEDRPRLALEFLKEHFRGLEETISIWKIQAAKRWSERPEPETYTTTGSRPVCNVCGSPAPHDFATCQAPYLYGNIKRREKGDKPTEQGLKEMAGVDCLPTPEPDDLEKPSQIPDKCQDCHGEGAVWLANGGLGLCHRCAGSGTSVARGIPESSLSLTAWLADSGYYARKGKKPTDPFGAKVDTRGYPEK